jgi:glycerol uptake facilitator-like aquaporin
MADHPELRPVQKATITTEDDELTPFEMVILILSIFILAVLFIQSAFRLSPDTHRLLNYAVILMVTGVTLAGTFTGYVTTYFLNAARKEQKRKILISEEMSKRGSDGEISESE